MLRSLAIALLLASTAGSAFAAGSAAPCWCRDGNGGEAELGEVICLFVDGRAFLAQCQMSLNVPTWRDLKRPCLGSRTDHFELRQPTVELACIDPAVVPAIDQM